MLYLYFQKQNFRNKPLSEYPKSFAVHHWAHTWLGQVTSFQTFNVREMVAAAQSKARLCFPDHVKHCSHLEPGDAKAKECLQIKHKADPHAVSASCVNSWGSTKQANSASGSHWVDRPGVATECEVDKKKFCSDVKPGGGRTHKCMEKAFKNGLLSEKCTKAEFS